MARISQNYPALARGLQPRMKNADEDAFLKGVATGNLIVQPRQVVLETLRQLLNQVEPAYLHCIAQDPTWLTTRARAQATEANNYFWYGIKNYLDTAGLSERLLVSLALGPDCLPPEGSREMDKSLDIHWCYRPKAGQDVVTLNFESYSVDIWGTAADGRSDDTALMPFQLAMAIPSARAMFQRLANLRQDSVYVALSARESVICLEPHGF